jgi:hypothetical protein
VEFRPYLRRLGLAALVLALAACIRPAGLSVRLDRDYAVTGASERIQGVEIDLSMQLGDRTYDAVCQLNRDGHMHLGIHHEDARVFT